MSIKIKTCKKCGKNYKLGYNGVDGGCDTCVGVRRDNDGMITFDGEVEVREPGDSLNDDMALMSVFDGKVG